MHEWIAPWTKPIAASLPKFKNLAEKRKMDFTIVTKDCKIGIFTIYRYFSGTTISLTI